MNAYVLAGGRSSRMGCDKARLPERGWPMAVQLLRLLERAGCDAHLVRRESDGLPWVYPDGREVSVVREDLTLPNHPLSGVYTALLHATADVFVLPCDVRGLTEAAVRSLIDHRAVSKEHPLIGVFEYRLPRLHEAIHAGRSVRAHIQHRKRVSVGAVEDRNIDPGSWPSQQLFDRLRGVRRADAKRAAWAERWRQRQRGVVEPAPDR